MGRAGTGVLASAAVAVAAVALAGCTQSADESRAGAAVVADRTGEHRHPRQHTDIPWNGSPNPFETAIELPDGRKVAMHYLQDKGLYVQDYSPKAKGWSKPQAVYRTETDACQGIELKAQDGTVAAYADFGMYCADGEPPTESVAAVSLGGLTAWDSHLTKDFDGWEEIDVATGGETVTFTRGATTLEWTKDQGFPAQD